LELPNGKPERALRAAEQNKRVVIHKRDGAGTERRRIIQQDATWFNPQVDRFFSPRLFFLVDLS
jgi:hypothetical protein